MDEREHRLLNFKKDHYLTLKRLQARHREIEALVKDQSAIIELHLSQFEAREGFTPEPQKKD